MAVHHLHGFEAPSRTVELGVRDSSKSKSSASSSSTCNNSNTGVCEKPESTNRLAIGLGVGIPIACALIVILILHYRHLRKLKKEELENQHIDVDMDDYENMPYHDSSEKGSNNGSHDRVVEDHESQVGSMRGSTRGGMAPPSLRGPSPFEPYYANAPYLPTVHDNDSKASLEEYSKSIMGVSEHVYPSTASVYSAAASPRMPPPLHHKPGTGSMYSLGRIGSSPSINSGLSQSAYTRHSIDRQDSPFGDHNKLPETVTEGDSGSIGSAHTAEADFDFRNKTDNNNHNHNDKFVLDDEEEDTNSQTGTHEHEPVELHRNDTKHFERVKSVYKEYMDGNVDDDEEDDHHPRQATDQATNRASQVPSVPVPDVPKVPDAVEPESKVIDSSVQDQAQTQSQNDLKVPELESDNGTPQSSSSPPESTTFYDQVSHDEPPKAQPVYENAHENEYPHEIDDARSSVYSARPLDDAASFMGSVRTGHHHPHLPPEAYNMYNYAPPTPVGYGPGSDGRPGSATSSQKSSKPSIPLPKLTALPTPHSLSETENPLSYAPQRRVKTGGGPASPKYSPSYSVLNRSHTGEVLPSPHALRSSVVLTSNLEYAPPKKYQANNRLRSNSLTSPTLPSSGSAYEMSPSAPGSGHSTPRLGSGFSTSLVPDARNDGDLLRPTMDMR
uniref:ARAD1B00308p n=1 Tax=Blastobotrys adeninivorans TaxID=409370 RepID=A0A060T502_BLAAD